jgi:transcription initiation factor TFIIIB Brf1 subunit/transcription initiation factor TFIIB
LNKFKNNIILSPINYYNLKINKMEEFNIDDIQEYDEYDYENEQEIKNIKVTDTNITEKIDLNVYKQCDNTEFCTHQNIIKQNEKEICVECGIEVYQQLSLEPEWRYYGENDSRHFTDPNRCQIRKIEDKGIYKDVESMNIEGDIIEEANKYYNIITSETIRRGNFRKSVIFACIFNAYKYKGKPISSDDLQDKFKLTKKDISTGLKFFNLKGRDIKEIKDKQTISVPSVIFIPRVMKKFNSNQYHINKVTELYHMIQNKSSLINRSNPQSVISGLVFYYCRLIGKNITCSKFSSIVNLSDITVSRISKNISEILGTKDKISLL